MTRTQQVAASTAAAEAARRFHPTFTVANDKTQQDEITPSRAPSYQLLQYTTQ